MFKLRSLYPLSAFVAAASLFAQEVPPPPKAPSRPPADPAAQPKVSVPRGRRAPAATPAPAPAPAPAAEAAQKPRVRTGRVRVATPLPLDPNAPKRGFWDKVLGRNKATPTPQAVAPASTPKPKRVRPKKEKPAPGTPEPSQETTENRATPAPKPEKRAPKATPEPKATPAPKPPKSGKPSAAAKPADEEGTDGEQTEDAKFKAAKDQAMADPEIQGLRQKSDAALDPDEGRKAMRAYNKALYRKMRSIDPSIKDRIDATEAAIMRKLGE